MSTRQKCQRKVKAAADLLDNVATHLIEVSEIYFEQHPEIAKPLVDIVTMLAKVQDCILKVHEQL